MEFIIVTHDSDFNDLNSLFGFPPKIVWIRTGNIKTKTIIDILTDHCKDLENFIKDNNYGCFEIIKLKY